jgi:flavin-dependent dehydrogenase
MCALNRNNRKDILAAFQNFLSEMDLRDTQEEKISSYVLPFGNFLPEPVFRNIMLVGDAAGFADPLLGEGIFYAQRSAELASQAILEVINGNRSIKKSHDALAQAYIKLLKKHIFTELEYAGRIRDAMFGRLNKFSYLPLKILMGLLGNRPVETVHGIRSYKWMKKRAG